VEVNRYDTRDFALPVVNNLMTIPQTDLEGLKESTRNFSLENPDSKRTHLQYKRTALSLDAPVNFMLVDSCCLLRFYTAYKSSFLTTFRGKPIGPIFEGQEVNFYWDFLTLEYGIDKLS
jgi:hypothetical protein